MQLKAPLLHPDRTGKALRVWREEQQQQVPALCISRSVHTVARIPDELAKGVCVAGLALKRFLNLHGYDNGPERGKLWEGLCMGGQHVATNDDSCLVYHVRKALRRRDSSALSTNRKGDKGERDAENGNKRN